MPSITTPRQSPEYNSAKSNEVSALTPVQTYAVVWHNSEGRRSMALVIVFGKDAEDGGPGVYIMADEQQMQDTLKMPNSTIRKGVRKWLAERSDVTSDSVPESLGTIDVGEVVGDPLSDILPSE